MRVVFFGSGEFGLPTLERLLAAHEVVAVVSQPARPAGRRRKLTPTPVAAFAVQQGLPVMTAADVNTTDFIDRVSGLDADASVVIAFGQKLSPALIAVMGRLAVNLHASLLPAYRGAAPINWAMIRGETTTGVSVIGLADRMDAGLVYATALLPIDPGETAGELHDRLAALGPEVVLRVLEDLACDRLAPCAQDESLATLAPKLRKEDGTVHFDRPAVEVVSRIHGLTPWPGARVRWVAADGTDRGALILRRAVVTDSVAAGLKPGAVVEGARVACNDRLVALREIQAPGGKALPVDQFLRGHAFGAGDRLRSWTGSADGGQAS